MQAGLPSVSCSSCAAPAGEEAPQRKVATDFFTARRGDVINTVHKLGPVMTSCKTTPRRLPDWQWILAWTILGLLAFGARAGLAQTVNFNFAGAPTSVANTGESEVLGDVVLSADFTCGTNADPLCISAAGSIQISYASMVIDNSASTGITVCELLGGVSTCNSPGTYLTGTITAGNSPQGGSVSFGVKAGVNFAAGDQVRISGVRARIDQTPLATPDNSATATVTASPGTVASFSPTSAIIARSADPLTVSVVTAPAVPCQLFDPAAVVEVTEEFGTAFVDYGDPGEGTFPGPPANSRPLFGATNNTRINLVLAGLAPGITIHWPASVSSSTSSAVLDLVSQFSDGSAATYVFGTPDQAASDVVQEQFDIQLTAINFTFTGTGSITGEATLQGQMAPPATPTTARPRYNHPLEPVPAASFLGLRRCNPSGGTISLRAQVDGLSWSGGLEFQLDGPTPITGTTVPVTLEGLLAGTYTLNYLSGGPSGATFTGYSPAQALTLAIGNVRAMTFNFTGPTIANLELLTTPTPVCPSANATVGTFQLANDTADLQIIPGGTTFSFTFNAPIVGAPILTGLGSITPVVAGASMSFSISGSICLPPGGVLTFSGTRLDLSALGDGQNATVLFASTPSSAIHLPANIATVATTNTALCTLPPTVSLTVEPASIMRGQNATLTWGSQNATSLDLQPGIGVVGPQGTQTVSPSDTTTYTLTAQGPGGSAQASATLTVNASAQAPVFSAAGITNGASFVAGISPGSISTIFGTHLSNVTGIVQASDIPLPPQLAGVTVTVNGIAAPLFAVANVNGQEQINFQVPWEVAAQPSATIVVNNDGLLSSPVTVSLLPAFPGIFTTDGTTGAILHGIGSALVTSTSPASPGEVVVLFATGLGAVTITPATGTAPPANPLSSTTIFPTVTVGGAQATVQFSGLAPGFVGLNQVNVLLPSTLPSGSQDLILQLPGGLVASRPVKIAIR